jgi:hypothetical protein
VGVRRDGDGEAYGERDAEQTTRRRKDDETPNGARARTDNERRTERASADECVERLDSRVRPDVAWEISPGPDERRRTVSRTYRSFHQLPADEG